MEHIVQCIPKYFLFRLSCLVLVLLCGGVYNNKADDTIQRVIFVSATFSVIAVDRDHGCVACGIASCTDESVADEQEVLDWCSLVADAGVFVSLGIPNPYAAERAEALLLNGSSQHKVYESNTDGSNENLVHNGSRLMSQDILSRIATQVFEEEGLTYRLNYRQYGVCTLHDDDPCAVFDGQFLSSLCYFYEYNPRSLPCSSGAISSFTDSSENGANITLKGSRFHGLFQGSFISTLDVLDAMKAAFGNDTHTSLQHKVLAALQAAQATQHVDTRGSCAQRNLSANFGVLKIRCPSGSMCQNMTISKRSQENVAVSLGEEYLKRTDHCLSSNELQQDLNTSRHVNPTSSDMTCADRTAGMQMVAGILVYCDGRGRVLIQNADPTYCAASEAFVNYAELDTVTTNSCGFLSEANVRILAVHSHGVTLQDGDQLTTSVDDRAINALRKGQNWQGLGGMFSESSFCWDVRNADDCNSRVVRDMHKWPNMFHACGHSQCVHWFYDDLPDWGHKILVSRLHSRTSVATSFTRTWLEMKEPTTEEPQTSEPDPVTSEPEVVTSEPDRVTSEPEVVTSEPEIVTSEPAILTSEPEVVTSEPEVVTSEPEVVTSEPEVVTSEPEVVTSESVVVTSEPEVVTGEPEVVTGEPLTCAMTCGGRSAGAHLVAGIKVYCDGRGRALIQNADPIYCDSKVYGITASVTLNSCGFLSDADVRSLAKHSHGVTLQDESSFGPRISESIDDRAVEALRKGQSWQGLKAIFDDTFCWDADVERCAVLATKDGAGWPNMYHSCLHKQCVHWYHSSDNSGVIWIHSSVARIPVGPSRTWLQMNAPTTPDPCPEELTEQPTEQSTEQPTSEPSESSTAELTAEPTSEPTEHITVESTAESMSYPTWEQTYKPTTESTSEPTEAPKSDPTEGSTAEVTAQPIPPPLCRETCSGRRAGVHRVAGSSVYCDGTGRVLIQNADPTSCSGALYAATESVSLNSCGYLSKTTVQRLAQFSYEVMLQDDERLSVSVDNRAIEALQRGQNWQGMKDIFDDTFCWELDEAKCPLLATESGDDKETGWPNMYHACGKRYCVHWFSRVYETHVEGRTVQLKWIHSSVARPFPARAGVRTWLTMKECDRGKL